MRDHAQPICGGTGPGPQAPDGCSVLLYRELPYRDDLAPVQDALPSGASVLELGCGTGRLTRVLLDWGLRPTAVDESAAMAAEVPAGADTIVAPIETLAVERRFDVVLLASRLINHPHREVRTAFIACAARHLRPGGKLLIERHDPAWLAGVQPGPLGQLGPVALRLEAVARRGSLVQMSLRYSLDGSTWLHHFETESLSEAQIAALLHAQGFGAIAWRGPARTWAVATR